MASPSALVAELTEQVGAWSHVSLAPHAPRAVAVRMGEATIGVLHPDGLLEVCLPAPLRAVLIDEGLAAPQPARPGREWAAARLHAPDDVAPAVLLLRLSYLYRRLLRTRDPATLRRIRAEVSRYGLPAPLNALYETMLAKRGPDASLPGPAR
jgi:hypothetical protein